MRVLHVIPGVAPRYGGPSRAVFGMCRALNAAGLDTTVVTTDADGPGRLDVDLEIPVCYEEVRTIFFTRERWEAFKYSRPLARWLEARVGDYDVVHVHAVFNHSSLAAARACRRVGVPYVVRPLGTLDPWSLSQKRIRKRLLMFLGARKALEGAAAIHYTSEGERRLAEGATGLERGTVVPLAVDPIRAAPVEEAEGLLDHHRFLRGRYVLALSRLDFKKGLDRLVPAFLQVAGTEAFREWRLVLAGQGPGRFERRLRRLVADAGATQRVEFPGWLEGPVRDLALQRAALLALPSRQENFALSVVEALGAGTPVLVSRHVNLWEDIERAGAGWVTDMDVPSLAAALAKALGDEAELRRRGAAGRSLVAARFTWPVVAKELIAMYHRVTS